MDASVPSQRTRIAKWLSQSKLRTESRMLIAYLATLFAHMRLHACVDSLMDSERRPLDETFAACGKIAGMRSDTAMDTFCGH